MTTRALVVHTGGIGDLLLSLPALARYAEHHEIEVAGHRERLELARLAGVTNTIHALDAIDFHTVFAQPSARFADFARRFDHAIVFMRDDGAIVNAFHTAGVAEARAFPGLPPAGWRRHASAYYAECLGVTPGAPLRLNLQPEPVADVIVHAGSGGRMKNWPLDRFHQVTRVFIEHGYTVGWSRGPAEEELAAPAGVCVLQGLSLTRLASALAGARLYIGNDSGITHLAAASGCPTLAIFGPTDPVVWAPRGPNVCVRLGALWPDTDSVLREITARFGLCSS